jgi:hypothetical protein
MVIGFLVAGAGIIVMGSFVHNIYGVVMASIQADGSAMGSFTGVVSTVGFVIIYCVLMNSVIHGCFNAIHIVPDQVLAWVGGHGTNSGQFGRDVASNTGHTVAGVIQRPNGPKIPGASNDGKAGQGATPPQADRLAIIKGMAMGFWDAWNAGGASQGDLNQAFENGKKQGHNDMARWCNNLQDLVLEEAAMSVGQRVVLDLTLDALRKADPMHWLLVRENRLRIAGAVRDKALKDYTYTGISTPNGAVYHKMQNGFLEKRVITDGEVVRRRQEAWRGGDGDDDGGGRIY